MGMKQIINQGLRPFGRAAYHLLDSAYVRLDQQQIRRTRNLHRIPQERGRRGGKYSYAEWAHVIGIFQTLLYLNLEKKDNNRILDVGCGTGLLGIASEPFVGPEGQYVGIDVNKRDIEFCRRQYPSPTFEFTHLSTNNPAYAPHQTKDRLQWPFERNVFDVALALSVWTHLNEADARFYLTEVIRVLKPGGKAIVTVFLLDETYHRSLALRSGQQGRYHRTSQDQWIFDQPAYGSEAWFHPRWARVPEQAIGITKAGLDGLASSAGLNLHEQYQGNWKEVPGMYFQDVLIFQKPL